MIIAWFSCGATSAVACKMALQMYDDVRVVYIETGSGHEDNARFIKDCEKWYGQIPGTRDEGLGLVREAEKQGNITAYTHLEKLDKTGSL